MGVQWRMLDSLSCPVPFREPDYSLLFLCGPPIEKNGVYGHNLPNVTLGQ